MTAEQELLKSRQDLERRILHGLVCEWEEAVRDLNEFHRCSMRLPLFSLKPLGPEWGRWDKARCEIAIATRLALEYPWASVRNVLLHEMAHQMADEVLGGDAVPHGAMFREACRLLRADPGATGDYVRLGALSAQGDASEDDRILVRVQKLLALAQSSNRHEAEAAMAKAHEHIARYNVDLLTARAVRGYCSACIGEPAVRHVEYEYALARVLCDFYFVEGIWVSAFVLSQGRMGRILEVSGLPANVKMAGYVHDFLRRAVDDQWDAFNAHGSHARRRKTDFGVGLIRGFRQRLESQNRDWEAASGSTWALIKAGDAGLNDYFRDRYPRIRRTSGRGRRVDAGVQSAGERAGRATVLSRPIEGNSVFDRRQQALAPAAGLHVPQL